jgi:hypothetical protein
VRSSSDEAADEVSGEMNVPENPRDGDQHRQPVGYEKKPAGYDQDRGYRTARPRNGYGIAALSLGLLALLLSWTIAGGIIFGILALIFGLLGRARAKRDESTNGGVAVAGVVLGIIGLIIGIGLLAVGVSLLNSPAGRNYQQCIQQSDGDPVKFEQCTSDFSNQIRSPIPPS